jgi:hypothetical protein
MKFLGFVPVLPRASKARADEAQLSFVTLKQPDAGSPIVLFFCKA